MAVQTSSTGNLQNMSRIMLASARYTEEHNAPMVGLIEKFTLGKGEYQLTIPKIAQMTAEDLAEGQDMIDSEDIDVSTVTATTAEVGLKVIITDTLLQQNNEDVYKIIGRQMGDAMARKKVQTFLLLMRQQLLLPQKQISLVAIPLSFITLMRSGSWHRA